MTSPAVESAIEAVTVFRSGALITRVARLEGEEVPDQIRLVGLPLSLDDASLQVELEPIGEQEGELPKATGIRVGLEAPQGFGAHDPPDEAALRQARREEAKLQDHIEQVDREMERLKRLKVTSRPPLSWGREGQPRRASPGAARLDLLAFQQRELERLLDELRELRAQRRRLSEQVTELEERYRLASSAREAHEHELRKSAVISLSSQGQGPVAVKVKLQYRVPGARWTPAYAVQLDRARGDEIRTTLACRAMVCQRTGEEWEDVSLTLTTADALDWCELPELTSMRIGRWQPPPRRRGFKPPPTGAEELFLDYDVSKETTPLGRAEAEVEDTTGQYGEETLQAAISAAEEVWDDDHSVTREIRLGSALFRQPAERTRGLKESADAPAPASSPSIISSSSMPPIDLYDSDDDEMTTLSKKANMAEPEMEMAKSTGILSMFGGRRTRSTSADWQAHAAVPPPEAPSEPAIRPDEELLSYGKLYMPPFDHPRRGVLTVKRRTELYLELLEEQQVEVGFDIDTAVNKARALAQSVAAAPLPTGYAIPLAEVGFAHAYPAEAPVSLSSDGAFHSIPLSLRNDKASLRHVTVPRESQEVFRFLELRNPLAAPLLEGPADVYVDGNYLLTTTLSQTAADGHIRLGLGVEPSIKISRNTEFTEETTGLIKGTRSLQHGIRIELVNHLDVPASVEVRERLPQPREEDEEIQVEVIRVEPSWESYEQEELPLRGGHHWRLRLEPGGRQELTVDYQVRIAAKYELVGGNRREA